MTKYDRTKIIRVGDLVRVINPQVFVRVGYNLTKQIVKESLITNEEKTSIAQLISKKETAYNLDLWSPVENKVFDEMLDSLAYLKLKRNGFGGKERKIFTEYNSDLLNKELKVESKRFVKTGFYQPGGVFGYFEPEYEPAYLEKEKSNIILKLYDPDNLDLCVSPVEIEAKNVLKI